MERSKTYPRIRFPIYTLEEVYKAISSMLPSGWENYSSTSRRFWIWKGDEFTKYDSLEQFFTEYLDADMYLLSIAAGNPRYSFELSGSQRDSTVTLRLPNDQENMRILSIFERDKEKILPRKIFVSHGHDEQWSKLKDSLLHQFRYSVNFYEDDTRAGHVIRDVLDSMLNDADIALILFTGEVKDTQGILHARDNVIHELGFCQGRLGFQNVILLLEDGVYEPSNVHGINQIRFPKGKLAEKHAEIVANIIRLRNR